MASRDQGVTLRPINRRIFRTRPSVDDLYDSFHRWSLRVIIVGGAASLGYGLATADYSKPDRTQCQEYDAEYAPLLDARGERVCK